MRWIHRVVLGVLLVAASSCVTTTEGNLGPQEGSKAERVSAHIDLARGYLENGDWDRARGPLDNALELDPNSVEAHILLALLYQAQGEDELVEKHYRIALRNDPDNSQALNNYGTFLVSQGRYKEAQSRLKKAASDANYPRRAQAYENLGLCELKLGHAGAAELAFQRALRLSAGRARSNLELADMYYDAGDYPMSMRYYTAFSQLAARNARSLWLCVRLARAFDDNDQIGSCGLALRNLYPGSDQYRLYRDSLR